MQKRGAEKIPLSAFFILPSAFPMHLYLLRHANADTHAATDDLRPLSEKGCEQAKRAGRFCREKGIVPERILTSPLRRAWQTAEHFVAELGSGTTNVVEFLASGMEPETAVEELQAYENFASVLVVGHEPDFSRLVAHLLGLSEHGHVRLRKGSLSLLEVTRFSRGGAALEFTLPPRLML